MTCPDSLTYVTPDTVAECYPVTQETYTALYRALASLDPTERAPLGGDGTDGTIEWPEPPEQGTMPFVWDRLNPEAQRDIIDAAAKEHGV